MTISEESFKGGVHAAMGTLLAIMAAYNAMRWCGTRQPRNAVNLLLYAPLVAWEWHQTRHHWSKP